MFALRARTSILRFPTRTLVARFESTEATPPHTSNAESVDSKSSQSRPFTPRVSRTHFLTIPLYEHSETLLKNIAAFRDDIIASQLHGLTEDTVAPRLSHLLELRLGSLNIEGFPANHWFQRRPRRGEVRTPSRAEVTPTPFEDVKAVLQELKTPIQEILSANGGDGRLHVPLGALRPLLHGPRRTFNPGKVNLLFLEPTAGSASDALRAINELVFKRLEEAGMWIDMGRPSTLSMTLANARYVRGRAIKPYDERVSFSIKQLYNSEAFRKVEGGPPVAPEGDLVDASTPRPVVLGEGIAKSLQLIPITKAEPEGSVEMEDEALKPDYKLDF